MVVIVVFVAVVFAVDDAHVYDYNEKEEDVNVNDDKESYDNLHFRIGSDSNAMATDRTPGSQGRIWFSVFYTSDSEELIVTLIRVRDLQGTSYPSLFKKISSIISTVIQLKCLSRSFHCQANPSRTYRSVFISVGKKGIVVHVLFAVRWNNLLVMLLLNVKVNRKYKYADYLWIIEETSQLQLYVSFQVVMRRSSYETHLYACFCYQTNILTIHLGCRDVHSTLCSMKSSFFT